MRHCAVKTCRKKLKRKTYPDGHKETICNLRRRQTCGTQKCKSALASQRANRPTVQASYKCEWCNTVNSTTDHRGKIKVNPRFCNTSCAAKFNADRRKVPPRPSNFKAGWWRGDVLDKFNFDNLNSNA